ASRRIEDLLGRDPEVVLWWATPVECVSALARVEREGKLAHSGLRQAMEILGYLRARAFEVQPVEEVRARAEPLLAGHPLPGPPSSGPARPPGARVASPWSTAPASPPRGGGSS